MTTGLNAVWGVVNHLAARPLPGTPDPGELLDEFGPISLTNARYVAGPACAGPAWRRRAYPGGAAASSL